jgi:hypothetical protein
MNLNDFKQIVKDELNVSCALPYQLPEAELNRIIMMAKKWFRKNYEDAVELDNFVITKEELHALASYKSTSRYIKMPDCVVAIVEFKEIKGWAKATMFGADFSAEKMIAKELYLSPFYADDLVLRTAYESFMDLSKAFFLETIAYDYNDNTRKLKVLGRDPSHDVFIKGYVDIPEEDLFEDWYFTRYTIAQAKISMGRMLGMFTYNLPGGVTINADLLGGEGKDELTEIKEEIQELQPPTFIEVWH